jgi:hypothetical protein
MTYIITIGDESFRIRTNISGIIIDVSKVGHWMKGKSIIDISRWVYKNKGKIHAV